MKWRWKSIKQFFNFYPSEKRGVLILMSILFFGLLFSRFYKSHYTQSSKVHLFEEITIFHDYLFDSLPCISIDKDFDTVDFQGRPIDQYTISKILKEQKKYGRFSCFDDLRDIPGISMANLELLKGHFPPEFSNCSGIDLNKSNEVEVSEFFRININKAKTFIKYRKSIGGFVKFEQINQIYGFPKKRLNSERLERLRLSKVQISKFDLKTAKYRNLLSHGMISRKSASRLNAIRKTRLLKLEDIRNEVSEFNKPLVNDYFKE